MTANGVEHHIRLIVALGNFLTDLHMRALRRSICRFANIVQQAGTASHTLIRTEFRSHHTSQKRRFLHVLQDILRVARAIPQTP